MLTYKQKHTQANREARATVIALAATIVVWIALGFGLSAFDVTIFHTPLWVIGGTIGTWIFSIVVAVVLAKKLFKNFDLGGTPTHDEESEPENVAFADAPNPSSLSDGASTAREDGGAR